jgi:hypothetical protein
MYQGCAGMDSKIVESGIWNLWNRSKKEIWNVEYGMTKIMEFMELMQYMEWAKIILATTPPAILPVAAGLLRRLL